MAIKFTSAEQYIIDNESPVVKKYWIKYDAMDTMHEMSILELETELLRTEYPQLSPDHDPDIERYYDLRALGHSTEALVLYQSRLVPRYPDDQFRTKILKAYRTHSPLYGELMKQAYYQLGQRVLERTKKLIKYIAVKADSFNETDVYSTIKTADAILALLPRERFEAVMAIERLHRYAERLRYCEKSIAKAEALIRAYVTESLSIVEVERQRRKEEQARAQAEERRRLVARDKAELQKQQRLASEKEWQRALQEARPRTNLQKSSGAKERSPQVHIDLNSIRFSPVDLARIQIPPTLTRIEDKTLAFCFKYWNLIRDSAFERILFLYSRKYNTKHYEVFSTIQRGRLSGKRDEEILASVMGILITGYYYSIQGDRYLQRQWLLLKAKLEDGEKPLVPNVIQEHNRTSQRRRGQLKRTPVGAQSQRRASFPRGSPGGAENGKPSQAQRVDTENIASQNQPKIRQKIPETINAQSTLKDPIPAVSAQGFEAAKKGLEKPVRRFSVSERLMHLSGRSYDVYQDLFLAHVRTAIRRVLGKGKGLFFSLPQEAEDLVYEYLKRNYSNPYMNWDQSQEKQKLEALGFSLPAIETIIDECYRIMGK
ncbi:hypothetical protein [Gracilinema caldarium]|nr:hypothetical protein [Gracilinema caldarium]